MDNYSSYKKNRNYNNYNNSVNQKTKNSVKCTAPTRGHVPGSLGEKQCPVHGNRSYKSNNHDFSEYEVRKSNPYYDDDIYTDIYGDDYFSYDSNDNYDITIYDAEYARKLAEPVEKMLEKEEVSLRMRKVNVNTNNISKEKIKQEEPKKILGIWRRKQKEIAPLKSLFTIKDAQEHYDAIQMDWFYYETDPEKRCLKMPALMDINFKPAQKYNNAKFQLWELINGNSKDTNKMEELCDIINHEWIKAQTAAKEIGLDYVSSKDKKNLEVLPKMFAKIENNETSSAERETTLDFIFNRVNNLENETIKQNMMRTLLGTQNQLEKTSYKQPVSLQESVRESYQLAINK